jgi:hypothetical protein
MQTESRREAPTILKIPIEPRGGLTNPRMSNVIAEAGAATETLYSVLKLFTGTTVVVAPALEVTTVTHIWFPLNQTVAVRPFCTAAARAVAMAAVISSRAAESLLRSTRPENLGRLMTDSIPTITTTMTISVRVKPRRDRSTILPALEWVAPKRLAPLLKAALFVRRLALADDEPHLGW